MRCCVFVLVVATLVACSSDAVVDAPVPAPRPAVAIRLTSPPPSLPAAAAAEPDDEADVDDAGEGIPDDEDVEGDEDVEDRFRGEPPGFSTVESSKPQVIDLSDDCHVEIVVLPDRDDDGVPDRFDDCPSEPEDEDGWQDGDGCPDPDTDREEIIDVEDRCPDAPEDRDGWDDGCPEPASAVL